MARALTNDEEDEVIEWMKSNRFLYDKSSFEFKDHQKKERAWLQMEQRMRLNPGDLFRWYTSLRTQYVKEVKKRENGLRSGAGAPDDIITPRTTWLLDNFEFLKPYVCQARATRGSKMKKPDLYSDSSESSVPLKSTCESTTKQQSTSSTVSSISDYLDKVSQQLAVPKTDIEKTCDFLSVQMAKMTPSCLEDFTNEAVCKAMEYVQQSKQERRLAQQTPKGNVVQPSQPPFTFTEQLQQASQPASMQYTSIQAPQQPTTDNRPRSTSTIESKQPRLTTDYIMARNLASSNPPADVLQQHRRYQWTEFQPSNVQPVLPANAYSTQVNSGSQAHSTTTSTPTNTASILTEAYETMIPDPTLSNFQVE
jgi:hypothetical protein